MLPGACLALLHISVLAGLICQRAAAGTDCAADQCTFAAAQQAADNSSSYRGSDYNLRAGVVLMVAGALCRNGMAVAPLSRGLLRTGHKGKHHHRA
jgi:hypothetical protein